MILIHKNEIFVQINLDFADGLNCGFLCFLVVLNNSFFFSRGLFVNDDQKKVGRVFSINHFILIISVPRHPKPKIIFASPSTNRSTKGISNKVSTKKNPHLPEL
jgi:hypothetical protein